MNESIGFECADEFAGGNAPRQFQTLTTTAEESVDAMSASGGDVFPFLGEFIHNHVQHLADVLDRFFSGLTPRCGADGFERGTVRPECVTAVLVLVIFDDDFKKVAFQGAPSLRPVHPSN